MKAEGYQNFGMHQHTLLWKKLDAKNPTKRFGVTIANNWYWYEHWVDKVRQNCSENAGKYMSANPGLAA